MKEKLLEVGGKVMGIFVATDIISFGGLLSIHMEFHMTLLMVW